MAGHHDHIVDRQRPVKLTTTDNICRIGGQSHNHDADFVGLAAESFISGVRKRCGEGATTISTTRSLED